MPKRICLPWLFLCAMLPLLARADTLDVLWHTTPLAARKALTARAHMHPDDAKAFLGLALLDTHEDQPISALEHWSRYCRLAPASWQTLAYWIEIRHLAEETGRWDALEAAARAVLAAPGVALQMRTAMRLELADAAFRRNRLCEATNAWAQLGFMRNWQVIGPFDNVSQSGFNQEYPPEHEIDFHQQYPGVNNVPLAWHALAFVSADGTCRVSESVSSHKEAVDYAVTAVISPRTQPAMLCVSADGACKVFVNDVLLVNADAYRKFPPGVSDSYRVAVTLRQGKNRVLIKLASDENGHGEENGFQLRFTQPNGDDLPGLTCDPAQATGKVDPQVMPANPITEQVTVTALRALPDSSERALALGNYLRDIDDAQAAMAELRAALKTAPECGWLHWELCQALQDDGQADEAHAERDLALKWTPRLPNAELGACIEQAETLESADYLKKLHALRTAYPASPNIAWAVWSHYDDEDKDTEALAAARAATALSPGSENQDHLIACLWETNRHAEADKVLAAALQAEPMSRALLETKARHLRNTDKTADAIAVYRYILTLSETLSTRESLADTFAKAKQWPDAERVLRKLCAEAPQYADGWMALGDALREQGKKTEAVDSYRLAQRLDPASKGLSEKIHELTGGPAVRELMPATPTAPIIAGAPKIARITGASAYVLLDEAREVVYSDYSADRYVQYIVKVFTQDGVKQYSTIPFERETAYTTLEVEKARVIKEDGKEQDVTANAGGGGVTFPSLAPGDTIEVRYHVHEYHPGALAKHFWRTWQFNEKNAPVALSRYVLITPATLKFTKRTHGMTPQPTSQQNPDWRITEWRATEVPAIHHELSGPGDLEIGDWVDISTIDSWREIVRWYRDLSGPRAVPSEEIRTKAIQLTKDATSERDKIRALATFVARQIRYQSTPFRMSAYIPTPGRQVLRERYGDCKDKATLLKALLEAVHIPADIVLVNGRNRGLVELLPSPRFEHAITRVRTANGPLWIDATADKLAFGDLPIADQGIPALIINDDTTALTSTPILPADNYLSTLQFQLALDAQGKLSGTINATFVGNMGAMLRNSLEMVPEAQRETIWRYLCAQIIPNCVFENCALTNLEDPDQPLRMQWSFHAESYGSCADDLLLVRLPWQHRGSIGESILEDVHRQQDLELPISFGSEQVEVRLNLPDGYTLRTLPSPAEFTASFGRYRINYRQEGPTLIATCAEQQSVLRIAASDLPKFRDYLHGLTQVLGRQLVLQKGNGK